LNCHAEYLVHIDLSIKSRLIVPTSRRSHEQQLHYRYVSGGNWLLPSRNNHLSISMYGSYVPDCPIHVVSCSRPLPGHTSTSSLAAVTSITSNYGAFEITTWCIFSPTILNRCCFCCPCEVNGELECFFDV